MVLKLQYNILMSRVMWRTTTAFYHLNIYTHFLIFLFVSRKIVFVERFPAGSLVLLRSHSSKLLFSFLTFSLSLGASICKGEKKRIQEEGKKINTKTTASGRGSDPAHGQTTLKKWLVSTQTHTQRYTPRLSLEKREKKFL